MPSRTTLKFSFLLLPMAALLVHLYFSFLHQDHYISLISDLVYEDPTERSSGYTIVKIALFLVGLIIAIWVLMSNSVVTRVKALSSIHRIACLSIIVLFLLFSLGRIYSIVEIYPVLHKHEGFLFREDGLMESLTALFSFIAGCLVLLSFRRNSVFLVQVVKALLMFVFMFVAMEEISWGQRIFGWETPESMVGRNYQNEINLHNYLNPILDYLVLIFNLVMFLFLINIKKVRVLLGKFEITRPLLAVFPSNQFQIYGLVFLLLALQAYLFGAELAEIVISIITLVFSYELYRTEKIGILSAETENHT
ncbi:MAG: hypothetical protein KTR32_05190 [Granulosicoccus sp.]|nr:hypothetical protein [Granulosicoccus sp.]